MCGLVSGCSGITALGMAGSDGLKKSANLLFKAGDFAQAKERYTDALDACGAEVLSGCIVATEKSKAQLYANRAACSMQLGEPAAAIPDLDAAIELQPLYVSALLRRAKANEATGELEAARKDALFALQVEPESKAANKLLARLPSLLPSEPEPEPEPEPGPIEESEPEPVPEPEAEDGEAPVLSASATVARQFDERRLLREGEWDEWDQKMKHDEEGDDDQWLAETMEQQMLEMRSTLAASQTVA